MTIWSNWTCPICSRSWEGSIGYFGFLGLKSRQEMNDLLEALCGCTGKKITREQSLEMYPSQKYNYSEDTGWTLKEEFKNKEMV